MRQNSGLKAFKLSFIGSEAAATLTHVDKFIVCTFKLPQNQSQLNRTGNYYTCLSEQ